MRSARGRRSTRPKAKTARARRRAGGSDQDRAVARAEPQPAPERSSRFALELFHGLPARYDMLGEVLSLGQNRRWRKATVDRVVGRRPAVALDVATGTCGVALQVARRTGAYVVGVDLSEAMLSRGRANVAAAGMSSRISLTLGRAERLPFRDCSFDALTYTYLLRYVADPAATLRELARVLKPGGVLAALEFFVPPARPLRAPWWLYTRALLPVAAGLAGGRQWLRVGRFLGPSISSHYARYPLGWTMRAYQLAGLTGVGARPMSLGAGVVLWGTKPDA